ncbi:response regulator transcription factor [Alcaligenes sp. Marseille-Q7550]
MVLNGHLPANVLFDSLTPRERDVLSYIAIGKANKVIAAELAISQRTVEAHRARVFQKLRVRNAVELTRCVFSEPGLLEALPPRVSGRRAG